MHTRTQSSTQEIVQKQYLLYLCALKTLFQFLIDTLYCKQLKDSFTDKQEKNVYREQLFFALKTILLINIHFYE